eukprot:gnl/Chilomastix_cuspidata/6826.p1 GENE.gnl/Chilomastix_cuspidata/6826~~gnl/Chilomastix_cuspidata/6826.p1  ORF type:complete len:311 (-),score=26.92 gnl/Chilomastix_cuspidata/6826:1417-2313(-)
MYDIYKVFQKNKDCREIIFKVVNPDLFDDKYSGESVLINNKNCFYRSYKAWIDLSEKFFYKLMTPKFLDEKTVQLTFKKLENNSFHKIDNIEEKYGKNSLFSRINKNEEPEILITYLKALQNVTLSKRKRVLNLGVNKAEEFELIKKAFEKEFFEGEFIGIDYCKTAINEAKNRFLEYKNIKFFAHDINNLEELNLGKFDLIISIGTLQSSNLSLNKTFMNIVQNYLEKDGALILGFPNSRWINGEVIYGAKVPNYNFSEMSLLYKDVVFCKKYLQQKKFRVTLTGKYYTFLTATSIR